MSKEFIDSLTSEDLFPLFESLRKSLSFYFATHSIKYPDIRSEKLSKSCGVFITFRDQKGNVRGSMGLLDTDRPLLFSAVDACIAAAVDDPRYERIIIDDVTALSFEMTLISNVEEIKNLNSARKAFIPGVHGFYVEGGVNAGVLLPRDIMDSHLSFDGALRKVCTKAGLSVDTPGIKYHMFKARTFLQAGLGAQVVELTPNKEIPTQKSSSKSKGLLGFLSGAREDTSTQKPSSKSKGFLGFLRGGRNENS